jgi:hypothetical protein
MQPITPVSGYLREVKVGPICLLALAACNKMESADCCICFEFFEQGLGPFSLPILQLDRR